MIGISNKNYRQYLELLWIESTGCWNNTSNSIFYIFGCKVESKKIKIFLQLKKN